MNWIIDPQTNKKVKLFSKAGKRILKNYVKEFVGGRGPKIMPVPGAEVPDEHGNINCVNCVNCFNCRDCTDCTDCTGCISCRDCDDCVNCTNCRDCIVCDTAINCEGCDGCVNCPNPCIENSCGQQGH